MNNPGSAKFYAVANGRLIGHPVTTFAAARTLLDEAGEEGSVREWVPQTRRPVIRAWRWDSGTWVTKQGTDLVLLTA